MRNYSIQFSRHNLRAGAFVLFLILQACTPPAPPIYSNTLPNSAQQKYPSPVIIPDGPIVAVSPIASISPAASPEVVTASPSPNGPPGKDLPEPTEAVSEKQFSVIAEIMATHQHRLYHALWHATRNGATPEEIATVKKLFSKKWGEHAPLCAGQYQEWAPDQMSAAGEEFLYMHRNMIGMLNAEFDKRGIPRIKGWKSLPDNNDPLWPVPQGNPNNASKQEVVFAWMKNWARQLHDPAYLKGKSLSYVGYLVEFSIHNLMHARWSTIPQNGEDKTAFTEQGINFQKLLTERKFDAPRYQWLGAPYSAHVNPIFWKLHGWVDDTIDLWLAANDYTSIAADCKGVAKCYQWRSTWEGELPPEDPNMPLAKKKATHQHYARKIASDEPPPTVTASDVKKVDSILDRGAFRNKKLDAFMEKSSATNGAQMPKSPQDGSPTQPGGLGGVGAPSAAFPGNEDPATFVSRFGPCAEP